MPAWTVSAAPPPKWNVYNPFAPKPVAVVPPPQATSVADALAIQQRVRACLVNPQASPDCTDGSVARGGIALIALNSQCAQNPQHPDCTAIGLPVTIALDPTTSTPQLAPMFFYKFGMSPALWLWTGIIAASAGGALLIYRRKRG